MTVDISKSYVTRDGLKTRLYTDEGGCGEEIHGAILVEGEWLSRTWPNTGLVFSENTPHSRDLVEVKPRIRMERWFNVYRDTIGHSCFTKAEADASGVSRLSCVKVVFDCEEGEGL